MKIVIAPDSYKGTMKSSEVADIIEKGAQEVFKGAQIIKIPFSDGGEGSAECFHSAIGGELINTYVTGPLNKQVFAHYLLKEQLAVVESAEACGLTLLSDIEKDPKITSTFGVGELIRYAINQGAKKIVLTLGGSSTNDGGAGMAAALGVKFQNKAGKSFIPTGGTLKDIYSIDFSELDNRIKNTEFIGMCDVKNTICGKLGASAVYSPQKGATSKDIVILEEGLCNLTKILSDNAKINYLKLEGGGAAGGLGLAVVAFLNGKLVSGIDLMMDIAEFENKTANANLLITGEGRLDKQSFMGKVIDGMSKRALSQNIPLIIIAGSITKDITDEFLKKHGVIIAESTDLTGKPFSEIKHRAKDDLKIASTRVLKRYKDNFLNY